MNQAGFDVRAVSEDGIDLKTLALPVQIVFVVLGALEMRSVTVYDVSAAGH